jgi:stage II sporulation protein D
MKFISCILIFFCHFGFSKNISVSILEGKSINSCVITIKRGSYFLSSNGKVYSLSKGAKIHILKGLKVVLDDSIKFTTSSLHLKGRDYVNHFEIKSQNNAFKFDDNIKVYMLNGQLRFINEVDIDHYVAGVVEGEAGYGLPLEYYKLQAILCRTYALKNINRHQNEGFNLCDKVHCQVYHHKCGKNDIVKSTASTSGLVVVDHDLELINTTFHSNCGGQTCNSEDVWLTPVSYLRSIKDSFCLNSRHSRWQKTINKKYFKTIFLKNKPDDSLELKSLINICQDTARFPRKTIISTPITKVRSDLNLNSTFFSTDSYSDDFILYGRGFGHGVGLCQEGGIEMSRQGFSYVDILKYYYTSVFIVNQRALLFFKED